MLTVYEDLPKGFLEASARDLHQVLNGPSLIHLPGRREEPLFVSTLLHGNEDVGLLAVQELLRRYADRELPRALSFFVGNVAAAAEGLRRLDGQPDFNRIWPGAEIGITLPEHHMTETVVEAMRARSAFASVDLHNNTGFNPHYACINRLDDRFFHLATMFSRTVVYFIRPRGVASTALAELCPSVTLECGRVGDMRGVAHAVEMLESVLRLSHFPEHRLAPQDIDLFHTVATVKVPDEVTFSFDGGAADICFVDDLDRLNFRELSAGTVLGTLGRGRQVHLDVVDEHGRRVETQYFGFDEDRIIFTRPVMPSMLTLDARVIRQDCLCYLMERYPLLHNRA